MASEPRHPRLLQVVRWFQRHSLLTIAVAAALMAGVLAFDLLTPVDWVAGGFYLIPLALIALTLRRRAIIVASVTAVCLSGAVMVVKHGSASPQHLIYLYLLIVSSAGLVVVSRVLAQLDQVSSRALARARLAQAEADIVGRSSRRGEPHELVESAVRRIGAELEADVGVAFVVRDGQWCGEAAFGSSADPASAVLPVRRRSSCCATRSN